MYVVSTSSLAYTLCTSCNHCSLPPNSKLQTHSAVSSVVHIKTTQRRFWYGCENCGPLLTPGCHLGLPGDGSPAVAGACIYLGSVPTLHYSAQPGPHLQPRPVNTTGTGVSLCD